MKNFGFVVLALTVSAANAEPVKCVDASGRVRYVDSSQAGNDKCTPVETKLEVVPAPPSSSAPATGSWPPPRSGSAGASPGEDRLREAQNRLAEARKRLAEQEAIRTGDERNYARVLERLKPYQDAVQKAERDVEDARREAR